MNYEQVELREQLAGAYVVGTLCGRARLRFVRACTTSHNLRAAVRRWEDQLMPLLSGVAPVTPNPRVWKKILRRTNGNLAVPSHRKISWRWTLAGVLMLSLSVWISVRVLYPPLYFVATLGQDWTHPLWTVSRSADSNVLEIRALDNVQNDPRSAYELWALPRNGGAPVSLGLLPRSGRIERRLSFVQQEALLHSPRVAVSLEPPGGSPSGSPTGPVLILSDVREAS
jgi:anti-sigma-K factor RskA